MQNAIKIFEIVSNIKDIEIDRYNTLNKAINAIETTMKHQQTLNATTQ